MEFTDKVVGTATIEIPLTERDIETIMVTALEGGIGYWAMLDNTGSLWEEKPKDEPISTWATKILLDGKSIKLIDEEDDDGHERTEHNLTLNMLIKGYTQNAKERPHDSSIDDGDIITADCIVQYALFDEIVYG